MLDRISTCKLVARLREVTSKTCHTMQCVVYCGGQTSGRQSCAHMAFNPSFDQQFTRKALRSKYTQSVAAEVKQSRRQKAFDAPQERASKTRAAAQSAGLATPVEQLQDWLNESGGSADALNLAYAKCVAARKLRQGEVCHYRPSLTALMLVSAGVWLQHCCRWF